MIVNNLHCDVTLQCQDGAVQVSGLILASFSPMFKQLGKLDRDTDFVMLPDFTVSFIGNYLEPVCCKKRQKSPNQETGLGTRGHLILNITKLILN